jgi:hypothetical protein
MKNIFFITIFLICTANICHAQYFNAGFRLGGNLCQIDGDQMSGYNLLGLVGGVFVAYHFNDKWEGQFEMLYSQKGSQRVTTDSSAANFNGIWDEFRIDYIEVPVMVNYNLNKKFKLSAGLGAALMVGNDFIGRGNNVFIHNAELGSSNVDLGITKGEFSGTIGVQYFFTPKLSLYGRFTYSLAGINKPNNGLSASTNATAFYIYDGGLANNVISFGLYYYMLKGGK